MSDAIADVMFVGTHLRQLDDKGRLALPAPFRDQFATSCYLAYGEDRCVDVFTSAEFERAGRELIEQVRGGTVSRQRRRAFAHSATHVKIDKQGRVTLDEKLREFARLAPGSTAVVTGNLDHLEIWSEELFDRIAATGRGEYAGGQE